MKQLSLTLLHRRERMAKHLKRIGKIAVLGLLCMSLQVGGMSVMAENTQELSNKEMQSVNIRQPVIRQN